jgi:hypothetical protein
MTFIQVPASGGTWPPVAQPVGWYDTHAEARSIAAALLRDGIPARHLTVLSVKGWRAAGDRLAVLSGGYVLLIAVLVVALDLADGGMVTVVGVVAVALVGLAVGVVAAVGSYFRRRTRMFLKSFAPSVPGDHVLLCAPGTAERARELLAEPGTRQPTRD